MNAHTEDSSQNIEGLIELGNKIYNNLQAKENIEEKFRGQYIAIDVKSEKYFIKDNRDEAIREGEKELPNVVFYVKRIGGVDTIQSQYPFFLKKQLARARVF